MDGNHEDFDALYKFPVAEDGLRWVRRNIAHLPRGYRTSLASGRMLAALGGANSVDAHHRVVGRSLWIEESITEDDLTALGDEPVDVLVGHDAPLDVPTLDRHLAATDHFWPANSVAYSQAGRHMFHRGFLQVRPRLYLGGHYHLHVEQTLDYASADQPFTSRVVILDMNGKSRAISQAILDVRSLDLQFLTRGDAEVTELTGNEGGLWKVHTSANVYIIDLDAGTVEHRPGPTAQPHPALARPLRRIEQCQVGELGAWTMWSDGDLVDSYRYSSTEVRQIERVKTARPGTGHPTE